MHTQLAYALISPAPTMQRAAADYPQGLAAVAALSRTNPWLDPAVLLGHKLVRYLAILSRHRPHRLTA